MIKGIAAMGIAFIAVSTICAQSPTDLDFGAQLDYDSNTDSFSYRWWSNADETFFIEYSTDLENWIFLPVIESGMDGVIEWGFATNQFPFFVRLRAMTDFAVADPYAADFDGDGVSNIDEVLQGSSPFDALDLDGNMLPDDWETFIGISGLSLSAMADFDQDGQTNASEILNLTNPLKQDNPVVKLQLLYP